MLTFLPGFPVNDSRIVTASPARILLLRPGSQTGRLERLLAENGMETRSMAMLEIAPVPHDLPTEPDQFHGLIYTSRNAVIHGPVPANSNTVCISIGPGTAAALRTRNPDLKIEVPERTDSEGLLALDALQNIKGQRWLIVTGRDGRDLIPKTLKTRGADVGVIEVYERLPACPETADLANVIEWCSHIVVFSGAGLAQLIHLCSGTLHNHLLARQLVVPSERVVKMVLQQGFKRSPRLIPRMTDADICSALLEACNDDNDIARPQQT